MKNKLVSVIIPAFNEEKNIVRLIKSIQKQAYKHIEVIVVDDGSDDLTVSIAKKLGASVYSRKHLERSAQRNFGASRARGFFLLFLDADMELSRNVIKECVAKAGYDKKVGGVIISEKSVAKTFWEKIKAFERSIYNLEGDEISDAPRFFSKEAFTSAGGYDESITGPEDWDLPETIKKKGYKFVRTTSSIKHYEKVPNLVSLAKKKYYYALKTHRYLKKHGIGMVSSKTVYFLRPVLYKNWKILVRSPFLTLAMIVMLTVELFAGGMGFLVGKFSNK